MRWVDLAHSYDETMTHIPAGGPPCIRNIFDIARDPYNLQELRLVSHLGTHVDAPLHFVKGGRTIDTYALDDLGGTGWVLPISRGPNEAITVRDLESTGAKVEAGEIVLLTTGWDRKFSTPDYHTHPYLAESAAHWLVDHRVKMVGVDCFSADLPVPRRAPGFDFPVHHLLLGNGILIAENLTNLTSVAGRRLTIGAFPLKIKGGDGAPARIFALET